VFFHVGARAQLGRPALPFADSPIGKEYATSQRRIRSGFTATAGTLTELEMFQNPLKIPGRTLGHTPFGVSCWLEVIDFDPFFGFLFLGLHVCYLSLCWVERLRHSAI
jgi:hypothetical protein